MMMTMHRLRPLMNAARLGNPGAMAEAAIAVATRSSERGPSKLARRLTRKTRAGLAGAH